MSHRAAWAVGCATRIGVGSRVTAPLFVADAEAVAAAQLGAQIGLDGPEGRHAVAVTRIGVGERILLGDGRGTLLEVDVTAVEGRDALRGCVVARVSVPAAEPRSWLSRRCPRASAADPRWRP